MEPKPPLVSIGMAVRNCERTVEVAIRSILDQTFVDWELLLIDDGSTDRTPDIARRFAEADPRIRLSVDGLSVGLSGRLNQSIAMSRGVYYARMDGDDIAYPDRLDRQVSYLREHPDIDVVGAWAMIFGRDGVALGKRAGAEDHRAISHRPHAGFPLIHPTYVGRIEFFRSLGYRPSAVQSEDQDMLLRASILGPGSGMYWDQASRPAADPGRRLAPVRFANVPEILLGYREERLRLKKNLRTRYHFLRCLVDVFVRAGRPFTAARAAAEQVLKGAVDVFAMSTGLNYLLLRHRALPATTPELGRWDRVWADLHAGVIPHHQAAIPGLHP